MKHCYSLLLRFSVVVLMLVYSFNSRAQYVTIPDANFVTWLNTHGYAGCMSGNRLDTTCNTVLNTHGLYTTGTGIYNFSGLQYFKNLDTLDCSHDSLQLIPAFPAALRYINCGYNQLGNIPALPAGLTYLSCEQNALSALPALPAMVAQINCSFNSLNTLPALPASLTLIYCNYNSISNLPALPSHLATINCSENLLDTLPPLPNTLQQLICMSNVITVLPTLSATALTDFNCVGNAIDSIPALPATLQSLLCGTNILTHLPALPSALQTLACDGNQLDSLPTLPAGLQSLNCGMNNIRVLPALPYGLTSLSCYQNQLTELPQLPDSMYQLYCYFNLNLTCLPQLKRIVNLRFYSCPITCLPDYGNVTTSNPALNTLPVCNLFNTTGCPVYADISGRVFYDANNNCTQDATDAAQANVKIELLSNGGLLQQTYTNDAGEYSFQALNGHYTLKVDTAGFPFKNVCQHGGILTDSLTANDTISFGNNFAFTCRSTGSDLGIQSIASNQVPVPSGLITVNTIAGDMTGLYSAHCSRGAAAQVQLTFNGPVIYVSPAVGALTPNSVNGNVITYTVPDLGAINNYKAFNTIWQVNSSAAVGDMICVAATISLPSGDYYPGNNILTHCFTVANAQANNVKEVYPAGQIDSSSQWLTYTIRFANTGTDTAQYLQITDTLDTNLNASTFQLLNTSAKSLTQIVGNIVKFSFANINLPTTAVNDSGSRGFIQYRVKTNSNLPAGTVISNTASITYNQVTVVSTNTVTDSVSQAPSAVKSLLADGFDVRVFPNPASSQLFVQITQPGSYSLKLFDIQGKTLYTETIQDATNIIHISNLAPGIYIAEISKGEMVQRVRWVKM